MGAAASAKPSVQERVLARAAHGGGRRDRVPREPSQGGTELEIYYRLHAPLPECPAVVTETRETLAGRPPSLVCTASCQIAAFGMEREPCSPRSTCTG